MKKTAILLALLVLVGAGCGPETSSSTPVNEAPPETASVAIDGAWELKTFQASGKEARDVPEIGATLTVGTDGRLSAKICNSMSGGYRLEDGVLKVAALISTKMFCAGLPGEIESAFAQGLAAGLRTSLFDGSLVLRSESGTEFVYGRSEGARVGAPSEDEPAVEDRIVSGVVISVDTSQMPVDGPAVVNVRTSSGTQAKILVPSFGLGLCKAKERLADVATIKAGDTVESNGSLGAEGAIVPCQSEAHYLRVIKK